MPRKSRKKPESLAAESAVLEASPAMEPIQASREAKSHIEPDQPLPEPDQAVAAFQRQREREQAVAEMPPPEKVVIARPGRPIRQQKSWGETVRGWTSHGETGVRHVTTTSPDMVGIAFPKERPRTDEEKREMEAIGLKFFREAEAWLKTNRDGAFDETQDLARKFAQQRREQAEAERER